MLASAFGSSGGSGALIEAGKASLSSTGGAYVGQTYGGRANVVRRDSVRPYKYHLFSAFGTVWFGGRPFASFPFRFYSTISRFR